MMTPIEFEHQLRHFLMLLRQEKRSLIHNQPEKLTAIVVEKQEYVTVFERYEGDVTPKLKALIQAVQLQQRENMLLTQQAISYQEMLMGAVRSALKDNQQGYGQTNTGVTASIINQQI